jgi:O-antigen/teichoic acid export membrane protein
MDKRRLALGTLVYGFANVGKILLQIVMLPLMAKLVGPSEYSLYALAMPTILFVMMLADGGLGASLARESESASEVWSSAFWGLLGAAVALAIGATFSSFLFAAVAHQPRLPPIMAALSACLVLYVLSVPSGARLLRQARVGIGPVGDLLGNIAGAMCGVALALSGAGVWSLVAQTLVTYALRSVITVIAAPILPALKFSFAGLRPHLAIGGWIVGAKLVDTGDRAVENVLVGRTFGPSFLGSFSLAYQIPRFLCDSVLNPLWVTLYVQSLRSDDAARFRAYRKLVRLAALILFPIGMLGAAQAAPLVDVVLGPRWQDMSPLFQILLITYPIASISWLGSAVLYAKGLTFIQLRITAEAAIIRLAFIVMAPWTGVWALWIGLSAANVYVCWRIITVASRNVGATPAQLIEPLLLPAMCATAAGAVCWAATYATTATVFSIALGLAGASLIYVLLLIVCDRERILSDSRDVLRIIVKERDVAQPQNP